MTNKGFLICVDVVRLSEGCGNHGSFRNPCLNPRVARAAWVGNSSIFHLLEIFRRQYLTENSSDIRQMPLEIHVSGK